MELKYKINGVILAKYGAFNRTAYGIEIGKDRTFLLHHDHF